ncbi:LacI family DNA-binding transcriptional regulator [Brachybacterium hainanense]|uniref:LacI family DNA-binding transcriptional regulator n=1 Tax=Brachybacterium hainanense TaxID=1541174 RepID=A0ABV6RBN6_9MICO
MVKDRRSPRPRLTDVAERAGVSMKTVSNVVGGYAPVSDRTREKVLAAIAETGYRPNLSARNLARGRSGTILLAVPRLELPYFASLAGHIVTAAATRGWTVLLHQTDGTAEGERAVLEEEPSQRLDGMIVSTQHLRAVEVHRTDAVPLVLLGDLEPHGAIAHVGIDNWAAGRAAAVHLAGVGCRRVAMIGAGIGTTRRDRTAGVAAGLREAGLPVLPELLRPIAANTGEEGERVVTEMLAELRAAGAPPPDGVFAVTDWVAMGALRALHRSGLAVPADVAVIGFDDIPYATSSLPTLSTIAADRACIADHAVALLEEQQGSAMDSPARTAQRFAPFALVPRESTARP